MARGFLANSSRFDGLDVFESVAHEPSVETQRFNVLPSGDRVYAALPAVGQLLPGQ
jgi:hypothetical protein